MKNFNYNFELATLSNIVLNNESFEIKNGLWTNKALGFFQDENMSTQQP